MSFLPNPIACDVCGIVKGKANHWYYAAIVFNDPVEVNAAFEIWPWDYPAEDREKRYVHLCGQVCATKKLGEWMDSCATPTTRDTVS